MNIWNISISGVARLAISYTLLASTMMFGLPANMAAQGSKIDEALKRTGGPVSLKKQIAGKYGKMSAANFTEAKANAAADNFSVATTTAASGDETEYSVLNVEFKTILGRRSVFTDLKQSKLPGATVLTVIDRFADVFVDRNSAWDALEANPNVLKVEYSTSVTAPPPPEVTPSALASQAPPESIVRGGFRGLTGKNVIIAVLDTGIDFHHPDFINYDNAGNPTSRIAYLWDTDTQYQKGRGTAAPFKFPNGTSIGTLYTGDQLTKELRSSTATIPPTDLDGHGTASASVAAGNGNADRQAAGLKRNEVVGVAPEADIIGVRLGHEGLENSYLLNAICEWLDKTAGKTPLVVSGSFGGHYSGHDGQRVQQRELNVRFPLSKAGRAIVFAAGNDGNDAIHAQVNFSTPEKLVSWTAKQKTFIKIYFDSADPNIVLYATKATAFDDKFKLVTNPITNQLEAQLSVGPGLGGIWFENKSGKPVEAHLYIMNSAYGTFSPDVAVSSYLVGTPGSMENAITVGSYDWNDNWSSAGKIVNLTSVCHDPQGARMPFEIGWLSCYSSPGPSRSGVMKPEIAAPGEWYPSADAKDNGKSAGDWAKLDSTGFYRAMNGTSAATPYTSGVVALMFQKKPTLTLGEAKDLLKGKASKTGFNPYSTGVPNKNWGYGKLDAAAIERIFGSL